MVRSEGTEESSAEAGSPPSAGAPATGTSAVRPPPHKRIFFGWYIAVSGSINNFFVMGLTLHGFGVMYLPIHNEMGWSMAALAAGVSIRSLEQGFMAPFTGYLVDRLGPRIMAFSGITIISIGLVMFSQAQDLRMYFAASVVASFGQSVGAMTPFSLAVMNWFERKRGMAMGILNTGNGLAYLWAPITVLLLTQFGWRTTLLVGGIALWLVCAPLSLMAFRRPEQLGYRADGEERPEDAGVAIADRKPVPPEELGMTVGEAMRTPAYYLLMIGTAVGGTALGTQAAFQVTHMLAVGYSPAFAGLLVGIYGVMQFSLRLLLGYAGDKLGRKRLLMLSYLFIGVGFALLANIHPSRPWLLPLYLAAFAPGQAAWVVLSQSAVADYFGVRRFGTLRGLNSSLTMPIALTAPIFAGWMFDTTGSYRLVFMLYAAIATTGALCFYFIRRPTWRELQAERAAARAG